MTNLEYSEPPTMEQLLTVLLLIETIPSDVVDILSTKGGDRETIMDWWLESEDNARELIKDLERIIHR